jgi:DNA-directed RNA polymerase specialized sigma24 family protein
MTDTAIQRFEDQRAHLLGLAYRMLGEMAAAEDVVNPRCARVAFDRNDPPFARCIAQGSRTA